MFVKPKVIHSEQIGNYKFVIYDAIKQIPRHPKKKYKQIKDRKINKVYLHHTGGGIRNGIYGPRGTALYHVAHKNWPGIGYHFYINYNNLRFGNVIYVYQVNPLDAWTWHTGKLCNKKGIGIVLQGSFNSPSLGDSTDDGLRNQSPSKTQCWATERLTEYLANIYNLTGKNISCHSLARWPARKKRCPGDYIKKWVKQVQESDQLGIPLCQDFSSYLGR